MKQAKSITISVFVLALALTQLAPLVWLVGTTFSEPTSCMIFLLSSHFTFGSLSHVWDTTPLTWYYLNTLILVVVTLYVQLIAPTLATYALAVTDLKGQTLVFAVILMQIIIPDGVLITPNLMTLVGLGLADTKVDITLPFFGSALAIFLLRRHFRPIPKALAGAAKIDGANTWQIVWRVYMSCAEPAYMSFAVISTSYHWNNYLWFLIVTNSPSSHTLTVDLAVFAKSKEANTQWTNVCATTFITALPLFAAFFFLRKQLVNSSVSAGIKG